MKQNIYSHNFLLLLSILTLIPLAFSYSVYAPFLIPKVVLLYLLAPLYLASVKNTFSLLPLRSPLFKAVSAFFAAAIFSSISAPDPISAVAGSHFNHMGLITLLCIYMVYIGIACSLWGQRVQVERIMLVVGCVGSVVGVYGVAQYLGIDPFGSSILWEGKLSRAVSTLGHANYLGNYLLYTLPLALWVVITRSGWVRIVLSLGAWAMVTAILLSGTRGAWIGLVVVLSLFGILQRQVIAGLGKRYLVAAGGFFLLLLLVLLLSSAGRLIVERVESFRSEGMTGSGRTLLWKDSFRMLPDYLLTGCGPEGYRREFLRYKSRQLALISPDINNESSHNTYLDAFLSFGLLGGLAYLTLIVLAFRALYRCLHKPEKQLAAALIASLAGVCTHNLFIYDQLVTGLYFFSFIALAQVLDSAGQTPAQKSGRWWTYTVSALAGISLLVSGSYALSLLLADMEARMLVEAVKRSDYSAIVRHGENASSSLEPTGAYRMLYANALGLYSNNLTEKSDPPLNRVLDAGIVQLQKALTHSFTPELIHVQIGRMALLKRDYELVRRSAQDALGWDRYSHRAHWLLAEYHISRKERKEAIKEAQEALALNPHSLDAVKTLKRARGSVENPKYTVDELIAVAKTELDQGRPSQARRLFLRALRRTDFARTELYLLVADCYEREGKIAEAVESLESYLRESSDEAGKLQVQNRIQELRSR